MIEFYDITQWEYLNHFGTKGTRDKGVYGRPESNENYYFKTSLKKEGRHYPTEFWSEIIASVIGNFLGFHVLPYHIAVNGNKIGCLSKSMTIEGKEALVEGVNLLTGYDNTYNPEDKKSYSAYTLAFIEKAFQFFKIEITQLIETILFDAIIGNSDRHQENWGFIINLHNQEIRFSPIYDSGCCLGRELSEEKVISMLTDTDTFHRYIQKGKAEFRDTEGKKTPHFKLLQELIPKYNSIIYSRIKDIQSLYKKEKLTQLLQQIDNTLPKSWEEEALSESRKLFIFKLIDTRIHQLFTLLDYAQRI